MFTGFLTTSEVALITDDCAISPKSTCSGHRPLLPIQLTAVSVSVGIDPPETFPYTHKCLSIIMFQ